MFRDALDWRAAPFSDEWGFWQKSRDFRDEQSCCWVSVMRFRLATEAPFAEEYQLDEKMEALIPNACNVIATRAVKS